jgi:hypothetical protein
VKTEEEDNLEEILNEYDLGNYDDGDDEGIYENKMIKTIFIKDL